MSEIVRDKLVNFPDHVMPTSVYPRAQAQQQHGEISLLPMVHREARNNSTALARRLGYENAHSPATATMGLRPGPRSAKLPVFQQFSAELHRTASKHDDPAPSARGRIRSSQTRTSPTSLHRISIIPPLGPLHCKRLASLARRRAACTAGIAWTNRREPISTTGRRAARHASAHAFDTTAARSLRPEQLHSSDAPGVGIVRMATGSCSIRGMHGPHGNAGSASRSTSARRRSRKEPTAPPR